jgi:hypothetical protein
LKEKSYASDVVSINSPIKIHCDGRVEHVYSMLANDKPLPILSFLASANT